MAATACSPRVRAAVASLLVILAACNAQEPLATEQARPVTEQDVLGEASPEELRFSIPYVEIASRTMAMELVSSSQILRVRSLEVDAGAQSCSPSETTCQADPASLQGDEENLHRDTKPREDGELYNAPAPAPPFVQPSDRLVSVDGREVSLLSFQEAIDGPVGSVVFLPLFKPIHTAHILSGFARVEILTPQVLEFEPTTPEREAELSAWMEATRQWQAAQEVRALELANNQELREQEEKKRQIAQAVERAEAEDRKKRETLEFERTRMTPHNLVHGKRGGDYDFRYEVQFTTNGPIGLNWDLNTRDKAVVSHLEPKLAAHKLQVIAPQDQLITLNGVDTSAMGPEEVVQVYLTAELPRTLVFLVPVSPEKKAAAKAATEAAALSVRNWTLTFDAPEVLQGWEVRLHLADWSASPEFNTANDSTRLPMKLAFVNPITGCQQFPAVNVDEEEQRIDGVVYLAYRGGCTFIDKANHARDAGARALLVVNNVNGDGRFKPTVASAGEHVEVPVTLVSKLDGELVMSVMEHEEALVRIYEERPDQVPKPVEEPKRLTNAELTVAMNVAKASRNLTFWYINSPPAGTSQPSPDAELDLTPSSSASYEFQVLPALFGGKIPTIPFRVVMAYPQETGCHYKGLGILATNAVVLVKRGGCSFGMKMKSVQQVGGAGMLLLNSDESLIPLMTDPRDMAGITIWGATIGWSNGTTIQKILERNKKNLPSLVKIAPRPPPPDEVTENTSS